MRDEAHVGYVVKVYPRFSETFVVSEILAREAAGEHVSIFSLRPTTDAAFHPELARVAALVHHIGRPTKPSALWLALRDASADPVLAASIARAWPELVAADVDDAVQAVQVASQVRRDGITHLHAHFATAAAHVARLAANLADVPYSFTAHAKDLFHESVVAADIDLLLRDAAFAVTVSDYNLSYLRTRHRHAARVERVYNGIELERFPFAPTVRGTGPLRVVAVGRLVEKKGFSHIVDAVATLRDHGVDVTVDIIGDGELQDELALRIAATGHTDAIRLCGPRPQDVVAAHLRAADVFVAPCVVGADGNADGLPTVLLEAMASGVACISTSVTGIPEVVIDGETGILCRPGDIEELAEALARIAAGVVDTAAMVRRARSLIEREFDSVHQAARLVALTAAAAEPHRSVA